MPEATSSGLFTYPAQRFSLPAPHQHLGGASAGRQALSHAPGIQVGLARKSIPLARPPALPHCPNIGLLARAGGEPCPRLLPQHRKRASDEYAQKKVLSRALGSPPAVHMALLAGVGACRGWHALDRRAGAGPEGESSLLWSRRQTAQRTGGAILCGHLRS